MCSGLAFFRRGRLLFPLYKKRIHGWQVVSDVLSVSRRLKILDHKISGKVKGTGYYVHLIEQR